MIQPVSAREPMDEELRPFLPLLGMIAIDSARLEWGLSGLVSMLTNTSQSEALRIKADDQIKVIKGALRPANGTDRQQWATTSPIGR